MRVLLIEDDASLCAAVTAGLAAGGIQTDVVRDGEEGLALLCRGVYDACCLDRMLPGLDGLTVLRRARAAGVTTPVLLLTALARVGDRVDGLDAGADDYLTKPFDLRELAARVWGAEAEVDDASLDSYIYLVRRKLARAGAGPRLRLATVRGAGYRLEADGCAPRG